MSERQDPESTRCTFIIESDEHRLFQGGSPGDRIEMAEIRDGAPTGFILTARILKVARRTFTPPAPRPAPSSGHPVG